MIGIYKITSPSNKIYIGQSVNIEKRFNNYKNLKCKTQTILYRSFLKYGFKNHKLEILCECNIDNLNNKERYYQDLFNVIGINGMNCLLTKSNDKSGKLSETTKIKINLNKLGRKHSDETKNKISNSQIGNSSLGDNNNSKIVLDLLNGIFYNSLKEISILYNINYNTLKNKLNGSKKNNTNFIYI